MNATLAPTTQRIFPGLRYVNAPAAIDWLEKAFGFRRQLIVPGPDSTIAHAQLICDAGMIMLGPYRDDAFGYKTPRGAGGVTQSTYLFIPDIDAHFENAKKAGAEIVLELKDTDYGSREYTARDLEGHLWHFGTYLPDLSRSS
jgi:uncharacterized glyoxalase superfamily protein PhnB